jgi:hypothetical protein
MKRGNRIRGRALALFAGLALMLGATGIAHSQTATATLVGRVTDPSHAVLPGASVEVRNTATNAARKTTTNAQGQYTITTLDPGYYDVTIRMRGFQVLRETRLQLQVGQTARLDASLTVGNTVQKVRVTADVGLLDTETSARGAVITPVELQEIPLNGRNFQDLAFTIPGVMPAEQHYKGAPYVVNGARADASNYFIDGLNDENARDAGAQVQPPLDSIQEFKMQTSNYTAQYGMEGGGVINVLLKSGGNKVHGSMFEFVRNQAFDARNYFDATDFKSPLHRNQFGATVGGPVVLPHLYNGHNRTFFLVSWESYRESDGQNSIGVVPTAMEKAGNYSQSFNSKTGAPPLTLKNPFKSGPCAADKDSNGDFPGNIIDPSECLNPVASKLLTYFPAPNYSLGANNYRINLSAADDWNNVLVKVDQRLTSKDHFAVRVLHRWEDSTNPFAGSDLGTFGSYTKTDDTLIGLSETHIFNPNMVNVFVAGLVRTTDGEVADDGGTNYATQLGIPGTTDDPALEAFPNFSITGYEGLGDNKSYPITYVQNKFDYNDVLTWTKGRNTFAFGGALLHAQYFQPTNSEFNGAFKFEGKTTGNALAELYLGLPYSAALKTGTVDNHLLDTNYSAFAEDDLKVNGRLTLNLGLRYGLQTLPTEEQGQFSNYIPSLGKLILASAKTIPDLQSILNQAGDSCCVGQASQYHLPQALVYPDKTQFAPRVGFAFRPLNTDTFVVEGGYGIFYTGVRLSAIRTDLSGQFPFSVSKTFEAPKGQLLSLSDPFSGNSSLSGVTNASGYSLHQPPSYLESWNLTLEKTIGAGIGLDVGYVGSRGVHMGDKSDINQVRDADTADPYRPYTYFGDITYYNFDGPSSYNALMVSARRMLASGLFFRVNYTYGKSLDEQSGFNYAGNGGYQGHQNELDPRAEYGRSDFDIRHTFSATFVYRPLQNFHNVFLRNWQFAGSGVAYSGPPFTPQMNGPNADLGEATRPNRVCNSSLSQPTPEAWFNVSCFQIPTDEYAYGDSGRNILNGPGEVNLNVSLARRFKLGEGRVLEFRWENFNVTNHTNFALPNDYVDESSVGTITSTATDNREIQLGGRFEF